MKHEHSHEGHSHSGHNHSHGESTTNLGIAFFLNLGFAIIVVDKFGGNYIGCRA